MFLGEAEDEPQLQEQAKRVLQQANVNAQPEQFYGELNGFSISLNETEATQLREIGLIKSVERDQPLPLTPPVDVQPAPTAPRQATALDDLQQEVRLENVRRGAASKCGLQRFHSSSGEILTYGVQAVWGGEDISERGNAGEGTYAFVIDSGVLDTTGDLLINKAWSKSWVSGEDAFTDGNGHGTHVAGTIAALANGVGVVGVAPGAEVISTKVFDAKAAAPARHDHQRH